MLFNDGRFTASNSPNNATKGGLHHVYHVSKAFINLASACPPPATAVPRRDFPRKPALRVFQAACLLLFLGLMLPSGAQAQVTWIVEELTVTPGIRSLSAKWDRPALANSFEVELRNGGNTITTHTTQTSQDFSDLTPGTKYCVRVRPCRLVNNEWLCNIGDWTQCVEGTPRLGRVAGLTVASGINKITASWTQMSGADGYKVQWKSGSENYDPSSRQNTVSGESTTTSDITNLTPGTTYTVRVIATNQNVPDGSPSSETVGTPESGSQVHGETLPGRQSSTDSPDDSSDDDSCPDYTPSERAGDVERHSAPDTLVKFVKEARVGVESILDKETEESGAIDRLVGCFGVDGDWKDGSIYLFAITDERKYLLAPSGSGLAGTYLNLEDENGCDVAAEIIRAARGEALLCDDLGLLPEGDAGGFVQYLWDNPADSADDSDPGYKTRNEAPGNSPKLSYVEGITNEELLPGGLIILGSGYYPEISVPEPGGETSGSGGGCALVAETDARNSAAVGLFLSALVLGSVIFLRRGVFPR